MIYLESVIFFIFACKIFGTGDLSIGIKKDKIMRKHFRWILSIAAGITLLVSGQSCLNKDDYDMSVLYPNAIVTVKPVEGDPSFYMQLDDSTTLEADNLTTSPFGDKEVRALMNFTDTGKPGSVYDKLVHVNFIQEVLTKSLVEDLGEGNDSKYGSDPVDLAYSWVNIAEDGYLTLQFLARWGNAGVAHEVNLLNVGTPEDPYVVEFRHNAHGDYGTTYASGIAAFRLDGLENGLGLPDTQGKTVDLTLKYKSYSGEKSVKFKYCTRKSTEKGEIDTKADFAMELK